MIRLNYRDARPIYEQVRDGLRHLVVTGAVQPGDKLPSVRALASSLAINPNTIQRAYEALESEGYLYSVAGKGSFIAEQEGINEYRRGILLGQFDAAAAELLFLGMTTQELADRLRCAETPGVPDGTPGGEEGPSAPKPQPEGKGDEYGNKEVQA